jgi:hypothetical protein
VLVVDRRKKAEISLADDARNLASVAVSQGIPRGKSYPGLRVFSNYRARKSLLQPTEEFRVVVGSDDGILRCG